MLNLSNFIAPDILLVGTYYLYIFRLFHAIYSVFSFNIFIFRIPIFMSLVGTQYCIISRAVGLSQFKWTAM